MNQQPETKLSRPRTMWGVIRIQWANESPQLADQILSWSDDEIEMRHLELEFLRAIDALDSAAPIVRTNYERWQKKIAWMGAEPKVWNDETMRLMRQQRIESRRSRR